MRLALLLPLLAAFSAQADEAAMIDAAKAAVAKSLRDPESARFDDLRLGRTAKGDPVVCGTVNARNAYGGYAGAAPFFYLSDRDFLVVEGRDPMRPLFESFCGRR